MKYNLQEVQTYYEKMTPAYLEYLGTTFQAGLLGATSPAESNKQIAIRARLNQAVHILDAGCGVGGPAIDFAKACTAQIDGVTISPLQQQIGSKLVEEEGLSDHVRLLKADFQALPFADNTFDRVLFLESLGHAQVIRLALEEAFRVLQPGGMFYCKDVFCLNISLNPVQQKDLELFEKTYVYKTYTSQELMALLGEIGFIGVEYLRLEEQISTEHFRQAMVFKNDPNQLTPFGEGQVLTYTDLPIEFGDMIGFKPAPLST